jgi:hypothetical protein
LMIFRNWVYSSFDISVFYGMIPTMAKLTFQLARCGCTQHQHTQKIMQKHGSQVQYELWFSVLYCSILCTGCEIKIFFQYPKLGDPIWEPSWHSRTIKVCSTCRSKSKASC